MQKSDMCIAYFRCWRFTCL